jgi:SAM-dependent methyltransferase
MAVMMEADPTAENAGRMLYLQAANIPNDHYRQSSAFALVERWAADGAVCNYSSPVILDLGCGNGNSVDFFRRLCPTAAWIGVDIADSPEVNARRRKDADLRTFDGVNIPAGDASIDLVFCNQVLTHADRPADLLRDVRRVLKPTGQFIGSTSQLEPMVSYSRTNFTPYGLASLLDTVGLELQEIRPGIDAVTLILRRLLWIPRVFDRFYEQESPLNLLIGWVGQRRGRSPRQINARKLLFAGQFGFCATARKV